MEWVRNPKIASGALVGQSNWFNVIETPDKHTIILKSDEPRPAVFDFFEVFNIIDREVAEGPNANATVGGTGPVLVGRVDLRRAHPPGQEQELLGLGQAVPR